MEYQDYKYIMNDMTKVYFGAELTYSEASAHDYMPFKMNAIIHSYFKKAYENMTIKEHLLSLNKDDLDYLALKNLKASVKINVYSVVTDKKGRTEEKWLTEQIVPIDEYISEESYHLYPEHAIVTELIISKLKLMSFSV